MSIITSLFFILLRNVSFRIHPVIKRDVKFYKYIVPAILVIPLSLLIVLSMYAIEHPVHAASTMKIDTGDKWSVFKGTIKPPENWYYIGFDDSGWQEVPAGYGYGSGKYLTFLYDMQGKYTSIYTRRQFVINNPSSVTQLTLSVSCDDSFVAYMNGIEVIRNLTQLNEPFDISGFIHELHRGNNVLAIQCNNDDIESNSFSFNPAFEVMYDQNE